MNSRAQADSNFNPVTESKIEPEASFGPLPLIKSDLEPKETLDPMPLL